MIVPEHTNHGPGTSDRPADVAEGLVAGSLTDEPGRLVMQLFNQETSLGVDDRITTCKQGIFYADRKKRSLRRPPAECSRLIERDDGIQDGSASPLANRLFASSVVSLIRDRRRISIKPQLSSGSARWSG